MNQQTGDIKYRKKTILENNSFNIRRSFLSDNLAFSEQAEILEVL